MKDLFLNNEALSRHWMDLRNAAVHFFTCHVPKNRHPGLDAVMIGQSKVVSKKWMYNNTKGWVPVLINNHHHYMSKVYHMGGVLSLEMHTYHHALPHSDQWMAILRTRWAKDEPWSHVMVGSILDTRLLSPCLKFLHMCKCDGTSNHTVLGVKNKIWPHLCAAEVLRHNGFSTRDLRYVRDKRSVQGLRLASRLVVSPDHLHH